MAKFNQQGPGREKKTTGRQRGLFRRTEGQLFPDVKNGRGRGQAWGHGASDMQDSDDLESLKKQYRVMKVKLGEIEEKIKSLESGK